MRYALRRFVVAALLDSFLQFNVFTSSSTAAIIFEILITSGEASKT